MANKIDKNSRKDSYMKNMTVSNNEDNFLSNFINPNRDSSVDEIKKDIKSENEPLIKKIPEEKQIKPEESKIETEEVNPVTTIDEPIAKDIPNDKDINKESSKDSIAEKKIAASEVISEIHNEFTVAEDILTIPMIQGTFKRINYSIRVEMLAVIKELSKQSRMSSSLIVERIFEKYLVRDGLKDIIPTLPKRYGEVKLDKNGVTEKKRDFLQIDIPIYYVDKIIETMNDLNDSYSLDMTRGHLVDILLSDSIHIMAPSE